jgi:leucine dehydrogenase
MASPALQECEELVRIEEPGCGLRGYIAIHNTRKGPAFGGTRILQYESEADARADAVRLARAMTYKAAAAELPCGGGKAVLFPPPAGMRERALERYGEIAGGLGGRFFTGGDVGITPADLEIVARHAPAADESDPRVGDINEVTAIGVAHALRACLDFAGLRRARVAIQGLGKVGWHLARMLHNERYELAVADLDAERTAAAAREFGASVVPAAEIHAAECDVFAPCALGGVLNAQTISQIRARVVCGCANNQLAEPADAERLRQRGILYAPDYVVNAGGLIRGVEWYLLRLPDSLPSIAKIYGRTLRILEIAAREQRTTAEVADAMAEAFLLA